MALLLWVPLLFVVTLAFPFRAADGVTELDGSNFDAFLDTHKPVMVMFYAPWCGHCKALHPEYTKFAAGLKGLASIGAVNVDKHQAFGSRFGIKGFPTIKMWATGPKKGQTPQDYNGQRTGAALNGAIMSSVAVKDVVVVKSEQQLQERISSAPSKAAIVVISSKSKSPPMFGVLSQDPKFKGLLWAVAPESLKDFVGRLGISKVPSIVALKLNGEGQIEISSTFDGAVEYNALAAFATKSGGGTTPETTTAAPSTAKLMRPTRPLPLQGTAWSDFCRQKSTAFTRPPLCIVVLGDASLEAAFRAAANEAVVMFHTVGPTAVREKLSTALQESIEEGVVAVAIRQGKGGTKAVVQQPSTSLEDFVQRVMEGALPMRTIKSFPELP